MSEITHTVMLNFADYTRLFIVEELLQENELPIQCTQDYYSVIHNLPTLTFAIEQGDMQQIRDFLDHAKSIQLVSRYKIFPVAPS